MQQPYIRTSRLLHNQMQQAGIKNRKQTPADQVRLQKQGKSMIYGYARVSTRDQNLDAQIDALTEAGAGRIFSEKVSGARTDRPQLSALLELVQDGDAIIITKLDRLGRSTGHLIQVAEELKGRGVELVSIQDHIDTSTAAGKLFFSMMAALAEFERGLTSERTHAGLAAARARGRKGGRPKGIANETKAIAAAALYRDRVPVPDIMHQLGIGSRATVYKYLRYQGVEVGA